MAEEPQEFTVSTKTQFRDNDLDERLRDLSKHTGSSVTGNMVVTAAAVQTLPARVLTFWAKSGFLPLDATVAGTALVTTDTAASASRLLVLFDLPDVGDQRLVRVLPTAVSGLAAVLGNSDGATVPALATTSVWVQWRASYAAANAASVTVLAAAARGQVTMLLENVSDTAGAKVRLSVLTLPSLS